MTLTSAQLEAARHFAPPLIVGARADRRGASLRGVNRRAVDYAARAGVPLDALYPEELATARVMAPPAGSPEAAPWLAATGLSAADVYPMGGEVPARPRTRWRWGWALAGAVAGAALGGPVWAAVGSLAGGLR